jgi:hypothetical protein
MSSFDRLSFALTNHVRSFLDVTSDVSWSSCNKGLYACSEHESCWRRRARLWYPEQPWIHTRAQFLEHWTLTSQCHERLCQGSFSSVRTVSLAPISEGNDEHCATLVDDQWIQVRIDYHQLCFVIHSVPLSGSSVWTPVIKRVPFATKRVLVRFGWWHVGHDGCVGALFYELGPQQWQLAVLDTKTATIDAWIDMGVGPWLVSLSSGGRVILRDSCVIARYEGSNLRQTVSLGGNHPCFVQVDWEAEYIIMATRYQGSLDPILMAVYSFESSNPINEDWVLCKPLSPPLAFRPLVGERMGKGQMVVARRGHVRQYAIVPDRRIPGTVRRLPDTPGSPHSWHSVRADDTIRLIRASDARECLSVLGTRFLVLVTVDGHRPTSLRVLDFKPVVPTSSSSQSLHEARSVIPLLLGITLTCAVLAKWLCKS